MWSEGCVECVGRVTYVCKVLSAFHWESCLIIRNLSLTLEPINLQGPIWLIKNHWFWPLGVKLVFRVNKSNSSRLLLTVCNRVLHHHWESWWCRPDVNNFLCVCMFLWMSRLFFHFGGALRNCRPQKNGLFICHLVVANEKAIFRILDPRKKGWISKAVYVMKKRR